MERRCYGCGKSNPQLAANYEHFEAWYCASECQKKFHLEAKHKNRDDDQKKSRKQRVKDDVKQAGKSAAKNAKTAGKVAKVVAPLVILKPYTDSGTSNSGDERDGREEGDSGTESH